MKYTAALFTSIVTLLAGTVLTAPVDSAVPNVPNLSEKRQSPGDPQGISSAALSTLQGGGLWRKGAEPQRDPPAAVGHPAVKRQTRNSELVGEH